MHRLVLCMPLGDAPAADVGHHVFVDADELDEAYRAIVGAEEELNLYFNYHRLLCRPFAEPYDRKAEDLLLNQLKDGDGIGWDYLSGWRGNFVAYHTALDGAHRRPMATAAFWLHDVPNAVSPSCDGEQRVNAKTAHAIHVAPFHAQDEHLAVLPFCAASRRLSFAPHCFRTKAERETVSMCNDLMLAMPLPLDVLEATRAAIAKHGWHGVATEVIPHSSAMKDVIRWWRNHPV